MSEERKTEKALVDVIVRLGNENVMLAEKLAKAEANKDELRKLATAYMKIIRVIDTADCCGTMVPAAMDPLTTVEGLSRMYAGLKLLKLEEEKEVKK
ncbi:MAG: hypothetical protein ACOYH4_06580 [Saccharofermentanales bacterium]|jgi:hypothetical protein